MTWLLVSLTVACGASLQGSVGFGLGLFSVPILLLLDPRFVPAPLLFASIWLTALLTHREWGGIDGVALRWALSGRALGTAVAASALTVLSSRTLGITFGVLVLAAVAMSASGLRLSPKRWTLLGAGTLSGFMGTTASIGGPPIALVYQRESGPRIRGTLSAYFLLGVSISLVGLALVGRFTTREALLSLSLVPGILVGFLVSRRTARWLDKGYVRVAVLVVSAAAAVMVIVRHL
jgi:uncharacterized membrane protein YfcA